MTIHNVEEFVERTVDWALYRLLLNLTLSFLNLKLTFDAQGCEKSVGGVEVRFQHSLPHGQTWRLHT